MLCVDAETEKFGCDGMPVLIVSWSDCVASVTPPATVLASTRTGVLTTPACTVTTAWPVVGSELAVEVVRPLAKVMPPTVVLSEKLTVCEVESALPPVSTTLNTTCEVSCRPAPPVPFSVMLVGGVETHWIEPAVGPVAGKVLVAGGGPTPDAVG